jgi:hypothetical protein
LEIPAGAIAEHIIKQSKRQLNEQKNNNPFSLLPAAALLLACRSYHSRYLQQQLRNILSDIKPPSMEQKEYHCQLMLVCMRVSILPAAALLPACRSYHWKYLQEQIQNTTLDN